MVAKFPNLSKDVRVLIEESEWSLSKITPKGAKLMAYHE